MSKSNDSWFVDCPGCKERSPTLWCKDCCLAYCEIDSNIRHSVGHFEKHKENIEVISRDLELKCQDCESENKITNLIFCADCSQFFCKQCDDITHSRILKDVVHNRMKYEANPNSWMFVCSGCPQEYWGKIEPNFWCHNCNKAYCAYHNESRHSVGHYAEHRDQIEQISAKMELLCSDCDTAFPIIQMKFCTDCREVFCMTCDQYVHHKALNTFDHSRNTYLDTGFVRSCKDKEDQSDGFCSLFFGCGGPCFITKDTSTRPSDPTVEEYTKTIKVGPKGRHHRHLSKRSETPSLSDESSLGNDSRPVMSSTENRKVKGSLDQIIEVQSADGSSNHQGQIEEEEMTFEELEEYKELLKMGVEATRFSRSGRVDPVLLFANDEFTQLAYFPPARFSTKNPKKRWINIDEITEIRSALEPDPEYPRFAGTPTVRQSCKTIHAPRVLSIILPHRTVDLEFNNVKDCDKHLQGLRHILKESMKNRRKSNSSERSSPQYSDRQHDI
mmetsp:Transcript_39033/g.51475  ORF Transcript_39033/g.51475 Transcript_39033/m.51475 type:complete len:500 (-) Transcript_39033:177-1676(-)